MSIHLEADGSGDYATLAEAISSVPDGAIIELGPGVYRLTEALDITRPIRLMGAGMDQTEIVSEADEYVVRFNGTGPFIAEDITFRHEGSALADTVQVVGGEIAFSRCRFTGALRGRDRAMAGLHLLGNTTGVVRDCEAVENRGIGIKVAENAEPTLEGNVCSENAQAGIAYKDNAGGIARQNDCDGNTISIHLSGQAQPTLEENNCSRSGTCIVYAERAGGSARRNVCSQTWMMAILVTGEASPTLEENVCTNTSEGITVAEMANPTLVNNQCDLAMREND